MRIAFQILKEFWLPSILAIGWTIYSVYDAGGDWSIASTINIFGPSFFLLSWASGQFFRVRKQARVESNLTDIETRVETLVSNFEAHTKDFYGYTTGGEDSMAFFDPMYTSDNILEFGLINTSEYPVFDIQAELIDLGEKIDPENGKFWTRHRYNCASLYPNKIIMGSYRFDISNLDSLKLNIFIQTRNSGGVQQVRFARVDGNRLLAVQKRIGDKLVEQKIPENFPNYDETNPENVFK